MSVRPPCPDGWIQIGDYCYPENTNVYSLWDQNLNVGVSVSSKYPQGRIVIPKRINKNTPSHIVINTFDFFMKIVPLWNSPDVPFNNKEGSGIWCDTWPPSKVTI